WGFRFLATAGLLARDESAIDAAVEAAGRAVARRVPGSDHLLATAVHFRELVRGRPADPYPGLPDGFDPWLTARDAIERDDLATATALGATLRNGGDPKQAISHAPAGRLDRSADEWHEALHLAGEHGLRLLAVDCLEGLTARGADAEAPAEEARP